MRGILLALALLFHPVTGGLHASYETVRLHRPTVYHAPLKLYHRKIFVTGYCYTGSKTYDGSWPHWGTAATDPNYIPMHTNVHIRGLGTFWTNDTGGAVLGYHLDLYVNSLAQAYAITGYYDATWRAK